MNREEFERLPRRTQDKPTVSATDLPGPDRTLLYGYTIDHTSFHVYLKDGEIHVHEFDSSGDITEHVAAETWNSEELIPEKRAYPHATDAQFARLLLDQGFSIRWAGFREDLSGWTGFYKPIPQIEAGERPMPCACKTGDARNPGTHNNQVRISGRCSCECHGSRR